MRKRGAVRRPRRDDGVVATDLSIERHLSGLRTAMVAFVRYADRAGLAAPVPTCPEWTVRDLVAHQGMVHRWAASLLRGEDVAEPEAWERAGAAELDPLEWLRDGAVELAKAVYDAPDDVRAPVFLKDAPAPRAFWARRQCHETTIHAVDAQASALGRAPKAEEIDWVDAEVAVDGIDELLGGFLTRRRSRLRMPEESVLVVRAHDAEPCWRLTLSPEPAVTERLVGPADDDADWVIDGPSRELDLRLWNRADPAATAARADAAVLDWSALSAVTWA